MEMIKRFFIGLAVTGLLLGPAAAWAGPEFKLGLNADNWSGQVQSPTFKQSVKDMGIEFIVWHISPEEIATGAIETVIAYCRSENLAYLFNTELVNYVPEVPEFKTDGGKCYRWDLDEKFLASLKDDPLFLGAVYDESFLMQALSGATVNGRTIPPYYADTHTATPEAAFMRVADKIAALSSYYHSYNKQLFLENLFPDEAFAGARGGAVLAPKLLKENYNDLMTMMAQGAARQYWAQNQAAGHGLELWACVDLWYLDTFPHGDEHKLGKSGGHSPAELGEALRYAFKAGYDAAYIEQAKGLMDPKWELTEHGRAVVEFNQWRRESGQAAGDWRKPGPAQFTVRRFPSGNPGGQMPAFLDLRAYGSPQYRFQVCNTGLNEREQALLSPFCREDHEWWAWFAEKTAAPKENFQGLTFNTTAAIAGQVKYQPYADLPAINFVDHTTPLKELEKTAPNLINFFKGSGN